MSPLNSGLGRSAFRGDNIVTKGLVAHLDANNINSYNPNTPSKWKNLCFDDSVGGLMSTGVNGGIGVEGDGTVGVIPLNSLSFPYPPTNAKTLKFRQGIRFNPVIFYYNTSSSCAQNTFPEMPPYGEGLKVTIEIWLYLTTDYLLKYSPDFLPYRDYQLNTIFGWWSNSIVTCLMEENNNKFIMLGHLGYQHCKWYRIQNINTILGSGLPGVNLLQQWRQIVCTMTFNDYAQYYDTKFYVNSTLLSNQIVSNEPGWNVINTNFNGGSFSIGGNRYNNGTNF